MSVIKPCCEELQEKLLSLVSKIDYDAEKGFVMKDSEGGYNVESIKYCPYCGHLLEIFGVRK
jgi:ATP-dependent RNA circularization protein (DNA/RNA ligase family)